MELILISDSKLKIMLSQNDMNKYDLSLDDIDYGNTATRRAFWSILDEARRRTGFDAAKERIFVQVFPCRTGGCEIFVTKLTEKRKSEDMCVSVSDDTQRTVYRFADIKSLLSVCMALRERGYRDESAVYHDGRHYYLTLEGEFRFINEYAEMRENKYYIYHILEHCESICAKDAVDTLAALC